jgi:hypothetical protein
VVTGSNGAISDSAFAGCTRLQEVLFTDSDVTAINAIGEDAFYDCLALNTINLGNISNVAGLSSTTIKDNAFENCPPNGGI